MIKNMKDILRKHYWSLPDSFTGYIQEKRDNRRASRYVFRPYFDSTKSIYIHIPKVAGKSISNALYGDDPMHHKLHEFREIDANKYNLYFKFGFVRNPWGRLYSAYNYLVNKNNYYPYGKYWWLNEYDSFDRFVIKGLTKELVENDMFFASQVSYLKNLSGEIDVDFIGKFESINDDYIYIAKKLGITKDLEKIGASAKNIDYYSEYSNDMIKKVREIYIDDVNEFNYDFLS
ncbi:sulfotransferase family 2 domain-containing protein [Desulfoluna spongiiphila]|uniref:Sulfotransferase family protein n=1 Tax=Desulfoluna spongiiphila TaxID=419481 RepID=A0A1G5IBZ9_9BACT|nr:sulfotransferase family 2 domain-containing protein [Desulfoluna spongiiphila]SCY73622.1 Sulfotransferase family protein [Desulfoluna spongiiphila]